ncbi:FHA domain-containing protein [Nocardioides bizhenqiangii]|uniref:FHA domain-containing protein n=1 Tax=Nocardioides bizhenqiangii TaxID=3095076 RepID=A0ABZ0ZU92_9ACTN|nr:MULTISPECIES: FHA domain-containing protein [unclassified Nocardioides]MDZ5622901.1 FHA domain-containing protein [Nocardioides sp. HM23]WQQ27883.1 FHA domain-containing protein [Nocardioides sp. HM61]
MSPLVVEVDGRVLRLEGKSVIRIGRAIDAEVVLTAGSVSRQHAELRHVDGSWVLVDTGSQFGTYVNGTRVVEHTIRGRTQVRCGPAATGSELTITPASMVAEDGAAVHAPAPPPPPAPAESFDEPTMPPMPGERPVAQSRFAPPPPPPPLPAPGPSGTHVARPASPQPPPVIPPGLDQTQVLAAQPGAAAAPGVPAPVRSGPDLLLVAEGQEHRFRHPAQITIGRHPDCTVVLKDPAASRMHGTVASTPGGWTYTNQSNEGTFQAGRRVTSTKFDDRTELRLGHPVAGPQLTLVPIFSAAEEEKRIARRRLGRNLLFAGIAAGVLVLILGIAAVAVVLSRDDDDPDRGADDPASSAPTGGQTDGTGSTDDLTDAELDAAKAATVKIIAQSHALEAPDQEFVYAGSGSIIREDGLILTNAHVAAPETPGVVETYGPEAAIANPEFLLISLTDGATDTNAPPEYRARVVVADGVADAAVIQIYANADGSELDGELALPTVPIGDSADVRAGDDVTVLGFPAVAGSGDSITVTSGLISTVINNPDLGPNSEFDTDARIAPGNSGGMAIDNDGVLIGLPTALEFDPSNTGVVSGRIRAIDVVRDLIESAEAQVG